jgi:tetratricopeptide (TPR) repeat protein
VVADMTIPNGNVYYEIGIRHACRQRGCVLISADWANPLFDLNQMRRLTYPLAQGELADEDAGLIRDALTGGAKALAEGDSPMYQSIPGFPDEDKVDPKRASAIREQMQALSAFQARVRAARCAREDGQRRELALALHAEYPPSKPVSPAVALEILTLLRDCVDWQAVLTYALAMPDSFSGLEFVQEQISLARSKSGDHFEAIGALEELIGHSGDSSERRGLIGGRYKKLADAAQATGDQFTYEDYLDLAIEAYEKGMRLDLNDFYPPSNLPFLYRERAREGDEQEAALTAQLARMACERDMQNPWARPTLLTLAFFDEDVDRASDYAREVRREGPAKWQLESTVDTLERSLKQARDTSRRDKLAAVLETLKLLLPKA